MKITVMGLRGLPDIMGGIETHCEELLPRVKRLSPSAAITVLGRSPYIGTERRQYNGIEVRGVLTPRVQSAEAIVSAFMSVLHARAGKCDLLHIHAIGPGLLTLMARLLGLRVVVTHHGADYERAKWSRPAKAILRAGEALSVRYADQVICVSASLLAKIEQAYPLHKDKLVFIPNGVPTISSDRAGGDELLEKLGVAPHSFILGVGRLVPEKGFDYLVEAFQNLPGNTKLLIAGEGDHKTYYEERLRQRASDRVIFLGRQPRAVILRLYELAKLFVLPSFHEGLPIAALEAGQSGVPVLLSDIAANLEIGLSAAHYFPVGDVEELARKLREPAERFAVDASWFRDRYDWERIAEQTLTVYRRSLEGRWNESVSLAGQQPTR